MKMFSSIPWKLIFLSLLLELYGSVSSKKPPHIIFIIIDDLGWNDVSFHGSQQIPTPNIDALASDGVILNNYYVQPICTPSRGALMTGKYPIKLGLQHDVIYAEAPYGLPLGETVLPQYLKQLGYATHGVGKWHLGFFEKEYLPLNRGFDSFFGYWTGKKDFYTHFEEGENAFGLDFHDNNQNDWGYFAQYGTEVFGQKAVNVIKNHNASQPLLLYLAHQAVHAGNGYAPLQAPTNYVEKFSHIKDMDRRVFAAMVSALDDSIGELFFALYEANMLDDSVIVFTTDNGAAVEGIDKSTGSNWPLRGSKYNMWEGGVRGVSFVWSGTLRNARSISNVLMHITDWLPTLYSLAGGDSAALLDVDGINQWPSICCGEQSKRGEILHNIDPDWKVEAIRKGQYKLLKGSVFNGAFDSWFDKEGKKRPNEDFSEEEQQLYRQVYKKFAQQSMVQKILLKKYAKEYFVTFCDGNPDMKTCLPQNEKSSIDDQCVKSSTFRNEHYLTENLSERCISPVSVDCGKKSINQSLSCNPMQESCLFNIEEDPCEYNNLATVETQIVQELESLLNLYRQKSVPILNQPLDPSANPKYHGYAWIPWKSEESTVL